MSFWFCVVISIIMLIQQPLYHPCTYETTLQHIEQRNVNNNNDYQIQPQYFLSADEIVSWGRKIHTPTNPVQSFADRERINKINKKPYFDVSAEQLQQAVNRLNIQQRLSKQQLNEQQVNGYRKIKVKIQKFLFLFICKYIYIYILIYLACL